MQNNCGESPHVAVSPPLSESITLVSPPLSESPLRIPEATSKQAQHVNFNDLLQLLRDVHTEELKVWQTENATFRSQLGLDPKDHPAISLELHCPSVSYHGEDGKCDLGANEPGRIGSKKVALLKEHGFDVSNFQSSLKKLEARLAVDPAGSAFSSFCPMRSASQPSQTSLESESKRSSYIYQSQGTEETAHSTMRLQPIPSISMAAKRKSSRTYSTGAQGFTLRPWWSNLPMDFSRRQSFTRSHSRALMVQRASSNRVLVVEGSECFQRVVIHPNSLRRLAWDLMSMLVLAYDILSVPFVGAFDPPNTVGMMIMTWSTLIFWSLDIFMSLCTGYQKGKHIYLSFSIIATHYMKTWMLLDFSIVGLDWALITMGDQNKGSAARLGRSLRALRFMRTLRLLRVLKLKHILRQIQDNINTETLSICFGILKIILCLVVANHVIACGWYSIGSIPNDGASWVKANDLEGRTIAYRYTTSLHWSLTQFTPASMEVVPRNVGERIFAVCVLLFAMITFSSFISILTASMAELRNIHNDEARQFWLLRRYFRDWQVSRVVGLKIQRFLEYAYAKQRQKVQEKDVKLFALLSEALRDELKYEIHAGTLQGHPLFSMCSDAWMRSVSKSLEVMPLAQGDIVFSCGDVASTFQFVANGCVQYSRGECEEDMSDVEPDSIHTREEGEYLGEGVWIAEAALWCTWFHCGDLQAVAEGQIIGVDTEKFGTAVQARKEMNLVIRTYADKFVKKLNGIDRGSLTDLAQTHFDPTRLLDCLDFPSPGSMHLLHLEDDGSSLGRSILAFLPSCISRMGKKRNSDVQDEPGRRSSANAASGAWFSPIAGPAPGIGSNCDNRFLFEGRTIK